MILGTTGSRGGPRQAQLSAFARFVRRFPPDGFVHGGASGWDVLAHHAVACLSVPIDIYPSDDASPSWSYVGWPGDVYLHPSAPPLERDRSIVAAVHWLLAVPQAAAEDRSGTWTTVRYGRQLGIPIYIIRPDGKIVSDKPL